MNKEEYLEYKKNKIKIYMKNKKECLAEQLFCAIEELSLFDNISKNLCYSGQEDYIGIIRNQNVKIKQLEDKINNIDRC